MNAESTQQTQSDPLTEFQEFCRKVQGKSTKEVLAEYARHIGLLLSDPSVPIGSVLPLVESIRPEVVASGVATAWPALNDLKKRAYLDWISSLKVERATHHRIELSQRLMSVDPGAALDLLQLPTAKKFIYQETKDRLAKAFLKGDTEETGLAALTTSDYPFPKVRNALYFLLQSCDVEKVSSKNKWGVARLALQYCVRSKMQRDSVYAPLLELVTAQLTVIEPVHRDEAKQLISALDRELYSRFFQSDPLSPEPTGIERAPGAGAQEALTARESPEVPQEIFRTDHKEAEPTPKSEGQPVGQSDPLDEWVASMRRQISLLEATRSRIADLEQARESLTQQLSKARHSEERVLESSREIENLKRRVADAERQLQEYRSVSEDAKLRMVDAEERLITVESAFALERAEWGRRVHANADGRVEGFQNSLGSSLQQLLTRIPASDAPVDSELGKVLLVRLHQVIDTLEQKGVRVRRAPEPLR